MNDTVVKKSPAEISAEILHARELAEKLKTIKPVTVKETPNQRLKKLALRQLQEEQQDEQKKAPAKKKNKDKISMKDLFKRTEELKKKAEKAGIDVLMEPEKLSKKDKTQEKDKDKDKNKNKELTPEKQEQKMKEAFSKVKLPSGMEIHQEGPSWVLVAKDGKQRTDVTDVMNAIDKYNKSVDAANQANSAQDAVQKGVDGKVADVNKQDQGLQISGVSDRVQLVGQALPNVKDANGNQVFKPEDINKVAETAVNFSKEKALLDKLKDPKYLEEMRKRNKKNEQTAEENRNLAVQKQMANLANSGRNS